ncbi:MAG TPA: M13 family metallopeptidase, partial [Kofleriaceae bacterium]|nr:M13 family metallopeptidase [Kofleriaceae bacterium]
PREPVNVTEPKFLQQVDKELKTTPVAAWKAYLRWQLLDAASPWLSKPFAEEAFAFRDRTLGGATERKPRAQRCLDLTETLLGEPVGRSYADRYFPPAAKAKAREIANSLLAVMQEDVAGLPWMAADTKKKALEKLGMMSIQIGYPDRWKDTSKLRIRRDAFWANLEQARKFNVDDVRRQVGKPTDRGGWQLPPSSPDAYLDPQLNELVLPAGFLQPPYFSVEATDAVNYGALGAGLAHDMTHAFDATGALLDAMGHAQTWWTDADQKEFHKRAQCIMDQYEGYSIEPGVHHGGKLVLNEALGDQAGVHFAYLALKRSMAKHPVPTVDGFTPEQQFFLAWAQFRGEAMRIETQRQIIKDDPHAVPKFRVIGSVSNLPEFEQAFSCKPGAPMVRPPDQRCAVW